MSYYDPDNHTPTSEVPELSPSDIATAQGAFLQEATRELAIRGDDSPEIIAALMAAREHLRVQSFISGPKVLYNDGDGPRTARQAAEDIAGAFRAREALLAHGPDPVAAVSARLVKLGVPKAQADFVAQQRIVRLPDGRVSLLDAFTREPATRKREKEASETFNAEQWATYRDGAAELTAATRDALEGFARSPRQSAPAERIAQAFRVSGSI